jgi:hypothetical protein
MQNTMVRTRQRHHLRRSERDTGDFTLLPGQGTAEAFAAVYDHTISRFYGPLTGALTDPGQSGESTPDVLIKTQQNPIQFTPTRRKNILGPTTPTRCYAGGRAHA